MKAMRPVYTAWENLLGGGCGKLHPPEFPFCVGYVPFLELHSSIDAVHKLHSNFVEHVVEKNSWKKNIFELCGHDCFLGPRMKANPYSQPSGKHWYLFSPTLEEKKEIRTAKENISELSKDHSRNIQKGWGKAISIFDVLEMSLPRLCVLINGMTADFYTRERLRERKAIQQEQYTDNFISLRGKLIGTWKVIM